MTFFSCHLLKARDAFVEPHDMISEEPKRGYFPLASSVSGQHFDQSAHESCQTPQLITYLACASLSCT